MQPTTRHYTFIQRETVDEFTELIIKMKKSTVHKERTEYTMHTDMLYTLECTKKLHNYIQWIARYTVIDTQDDSGGIGIVSSADFCKCSCMIVCSTSISSKFSSL